MQPILCIQELRVKSEQIKQVTNTPQEYCIIENENSMNMPQKIFVYTDN